MHFKAAIATAVTAILTCGGCATVGLPAAAPAERTIISRYSCQLEYTIVGGTIRANAELNEDGTLYAQSGIRWEFSSEGSFTPSLADPRYKVLPPRYILAWPLNSDGAIDPALGQIYVNRHVFPADRTQSLPEQVRIGLRSSLAQPGFGNARFGTDPVPATGSLNFFASLVEAVALGRGGGALFGIVTDADGALLDYWSMDYARFEAVRAQVPSAQARLEMLRENFREECMFIEDVEANRIYLTDNS
ncbi:hypothetical protein [Erythrobacter sp. MTPC3]|uniref:hypothetical protein n=1 Tax=Erythrobacter sp. MTPC3 TaxID=3056564 RepID=UPI0036F23159